MSSHGLRHVGRGKACDRRCHRVELLSAATWFSQTHTSMVVLSFGCAANWRLTFLSPSASPRSLPRDPGQEPKLLHATHQAIRSYPPPGRYARRSHTGQARMSQWEIVTGTH